MCRCSLHRWNAVLLMGFPVAWLTMSSGCQHTGPRVPAAHPPAVTPVAKTAKLNTGQLADLKVAMGRSLEKRGEDEKAAAAYQEALDNDPSRTDACVRLAVLYDRAGRFRESQELYRKALALQPRNADLLCDQGYSFYLQERYTEAAGALRKAIELDASHRRAHNNLGLVLARCGDVQAALSEFRSAGCPEADAHVNLAFALTLQEHWPEARKHYQEARAADPACQAAQKGLRELESVMAKLAPVPARQVGNSTPPAPAAVAQRCEPVSKPDAAVQPVRFNTPGQ